MNPFFSWKTALATAVWLFLMAQSAAAQPFPLPTDLGPTNTYGYGLQRTLRALATSDPEEKRTIRVICYGQSITSQAWYWDIKKHLEQTFPNADLRITNSALSLLSYSLLESAELDIYPAYPDLMIFQVYGPISFYEQLIARTRARTTAEILVHNEHVHLQDELHEALPPAPLHPDSNAYRNYVQIPAIVEKYGGELADIRTYWRQYLLDNGLATTNVLRDHIHFNSQGNFLFTELLKPHFRVDWSLPAPATNAVITYKIGEHVAWQGNELTLPFVGNRVDLLFDSAESPCGLRFEIDGKKPSEFPELYYTTRVTMMDGPWPYLLKVGARTPRVVEEYTLEITEFISATLSVRYRLHGSVSGFEGEGWSLQDFVSNSGRVVLTPFDWSQARYWWSFGYAPEPGTLVKWKVYGLFQDEFTPNFSPASTIENITTIASGLGNGSHTLKITGGACSGLSAIRIYNPLAMPHPPRDTISLKLTPAANEELVVQFQGEGRYVLERNDSLAAQGWVARSAAITEKQLRVKMPGKTAFWRARVID